MALTLGMALSLAFGGAQGAAQAAPLVDLTFPVADPGSGVSYTDTFTAPRSGGARMHSATDIMAPKHRPIHAAVGGTISFAPSEQPSYGWMVSIRADDGRRYSYVHINNDTPGTDDGAGGLEHAYAPRIVEAIRTTGSARGLRIDRGELIGFNGDSGNAEATAPHLHFEIWVDDGAGGEVRINPYESLLDAQARGDVPGAATASFDGLFRDVDPSGAHGPAIGRLAAAGIVVGCDATRYCPHDAVTRGDLAASFAVALDLDTSATPRFGDVSDTDRNAGAIAAVDAAGILNGYGDDTFGPDDALTRAQLATVLVTGFELPFSELAVPFVDVLPTGVHSPNIAATYAASLTKGCTTDRYCGGDPVTRGQIATFLDAGIATR